MTVPSSSIGWTHPTAETSVQDHVAQIAVAHPERIAVDDGRRRLTYAELVGVAGAGAATLRPPLVDERPVAVVLDRGFETTVATLAVLWAGGFFVSIDPHEPHGPARALTARVRPSVVVTSSRHASFVEEVVDTEVPVVDVDGLLTPTPSADTSPPASVAPGAPMWLPRTSGTTSVPKLIVRPHRAELHAALVQPSVLTSALRHRRWGMVSTGQVTGVTGNPFKALCNGDTICTYDLRDAGAGSFGPWLDASGITTLMVVPSLLRGLLGEATTDGHSTSLECVQLGGEGVSWEDVGWLRSRVGPHVIVVHAWGATEITVGSSFLIPPDMPLGTGPLPIGLPAEDTQIDLLTEEGHPAAVDQVGRVVVRSRYAATGFWDEPDETARVFRPIRGEDGAQVATEVHLSDRARRDADGRLWHAGRGDAMVKIGGARVEMDEVEAVLRQVDGIVAAAVAPVGNPPRLVAWVVADGSLPAPAHVRSACRERLPLRAVPVAINEVSALPRLASGKLDRRTVASWAERAVDGPTSPVARPVHRAVGSRLRERWAAVRRRLGQRPPAD